MKLLFKSLSLAPKSVRQKLIIAFCLMSLIPMFVFGYFIFYYIFPNINTFGEVFLIFVITIFLMLLGFYLAREIIYPIAEISAHAKGIAEGNLGGMLDVKGEDEIGDLKDSLNRLSAKLKENMSELHSYGEKIKQINMEINKKVFALSSLLQIGNLITTACNLDEVLNLIVEKLSQLQKSGIAAIFLRDKESNGLAMKTWANIPDEQVKEYEIRMSQDVFGTVLATVQPLVIDMQRKPKDTGLRKILLAKNITCVPVTSSGKVIGILVAGNNQDNFIFSDDEIELIGVFAKQVAVAIENDSLMRKTEELTIKDELTGLYNEGYIRGRLDEEIKRAVTYQRPCSFVIFEVDNFEHYRDVQGEIVAERTLKKISQTLRESTTEIDKVARFSDHQFAVILPEKNKKEALKIAENVSEEIERFSQAQSNIKPSAPLKIKGGISATPIDGMTSVELVNRALYYIEKAKGEGISKIISS